jgi:hypothetical protein
VKRAVEFVGVGEGPIIEKREQPLRHQAHNKKISNNCGENYKRETNNLLPHKRVGASNGTGGAHSGEIKEFAEGIPGDEAGGPGFRRTEVRSFGVVRSLTKHDGCRGVTFNQISRNNLGPDLMADG